VHHHSVMTTEINNIT